MQPAGRPQARVTDGAGSGSLWKVLSGTLSLPAGAEWPDQPPMRCLATKAAAWARRSRFSLERMLLT